MGSLTNQIRRLTGASITDVPDPDIEAALKAHRQWEDQLPIDLLVDVANVSKRGEVIDAWGSFQSATQADTTAVTLTDSLGAAPAGTWTLDEDGIVVFSADQALAGTLYLSAYSYDVHAAAVEVMDQLLALTAGDYDVKLGDQTFSRSQAQAQLQTRRAQLARQVLTTSVIRGRVDEVPSTRRLRGRR